VTADAASARRTLAGVLGVARAHMLVWSQYRANLVIWATTGILQVVVYLSVWRAVAEASGGSTSGFTPAQFAGYFCAFLVVREATFSFIAWHLAGHVREGTISMLLSRPQHPALYLVSEMTTYRATSLLLVVPIAGVLFVAFDATIDTTAPAVLVALALLPLACAVRMVGDVLLGLVSVKFIRINGILAGYYTVVLFFSGQFAPIAVLPDWMQVVAKALPFWWIAGYPTELLVGRAQVDDSWIALAVLAAWMAGYWVVFRRVWPRAMRASETVGG
jgi:ABC-2 type transport system permease protein